ncbi:MAG: Rossmann-like domain-containing protein [Candidatus Hermodarchaeota archaeon]
MTITSEYIEIIKHIARTIEIPAIQKIFFPDYNINKISKKSNFGAIELEDGTIGVIYINLSEKVKERGSNTDPMEFVGMNIFDLAKKFSSSDKFEKTIGLGAINAISQYIFKKSDFQFDLATDSLGLVDLNSKDKVGMVGFFPPLVKIIEELDIPLVVIELNMNLVQTTEKWEVTLDSNRLKECNKVLITSTTVLNSTVDSILEKCSHAEKISMVGPTAGFLPDPLFKRNIDVIGSTFIHDSNLFMELITQNKRWGPSTRKYCIQRKNYDGFVSLLKKVTR